MYTVKLFVRNINFYDGYSLILGVFSFVIGILVLETITLKDKVINILDEEQTNKSQSELFSSSKNIMVEFLKHKKNFTGFSDIHVNAIEDHNKLIADLTKLVKNHNVQLENYRKLILFDNKAKNNWFEIEKSFYSYMKLIDSINLEITVLEENHKRKKFKDGWENKF